MHATLDSTALKGLTRALVCLSKYGEDLIIYATPETLALSVTSSSLAAYCRFKFSKHYFTRYTLGSSKSLSFGGDVQDIPTSTGQLLTKSLLSILKHRTVEKSVTSCELTIVDGDTVGQAGEDSDSLESCLIVRLHCKHGVVKTHRLLLLATTSLRAPNIPDTPHESMVLIRPRSLKDMIEHFPPPRSPKVDPQLVWHFGVSDVQVKSFEPSTDAKGRAQLSTELTISAEEFDEYDIHSAPITMAFQLREFTAAIAYAESAALSLEIRFTDPAAPLFITLKDDAFNVLIVISTRQATDDTFNDVRRGDSAGPTTVQLSRGKKRPLENDDVKSNSGTTSRASSRPLERRKPMKAVHDIDRESLARELNGNSGPSMFRSPTPSVRPVSSQNASAGPSHSNEGPLPLFLPGSQLSQADQQAIRDSGLGIENMTAQEFEALFEGEGEEVDLEFDSVNDLEGQRHEDHSEKRDDEGRGDSLEIFEEEMDATQYDGGTKEFRPLFED